MKVVLLRLQAIEVELNNNTNRWCQPFFEPLQALGVKSYMPSTMNSWDQQLACVVVADVVPGYCHRSSNLYIGTFKL